MLSQEDKEWISALLITRIEDAKSELKETVINTETKLLSEFWKWARTNDVHIRQSKSNISMIDERLTILESRVTDLEFHKK